MNFFGTGKGFNKLLAEQLANRIGDILFIDAMKEDVPEEFTKTWIQA